MSRGEEHIVSILKAAGIRFEREKTFKDLKNGAFRFDFYLPYVQGGCIVEYDGEQHFKQVKNFQKTRSDFLKQQEHDRMKNSYCLANQIHLYRIPYWKLSSIHTAADLFKDEFLVRSKWHNDMINFPR